MPINYFLKILQKFRLQFILITLGIVVIAAGIFFQKRINIGNANVEVLQTPGTSQLKETNSPTNNIVVDVSGAVLTPGVYHLTSGSRVEDALIASGGLSESANRDWVNKYLNKAAKLIDGQKLYIPQQSEVLSASNLATGSNVAQSSSIPDGSLVNINTASSADLNGLPGIGQTYAQNIIDHRPYSNI